MGTRGCARVQIFKTSSSLHSLGGGVSWRYSTDVLEVVAIYLAWLDSGLELIL